MVEVKWLYRLRIYQEISVSGEKKTCFLLLGPSPMEIQTRMKGSYLEGI